MGAGFDSLGLAKAIAGRMGAPAFDDVIKSSVIADKGAEAGGKRAKAVGEEGVLISRAMQETVNERMREAADVVGKRLKNLGWPMSASPDTDIKALAFLVKNATDPEVAREALGFLAGRIEEVEDPAHLKLILLNSNDEKARRMAVEKLSQSVGRHDDTVTLIHIALWAREDRPRFEAVNKLRGKKDALTVVSNHSEYENTRACARNWLEFST